MSAKWRGLPVRRRYPFATGHGDDEHVDIADRPPDPQKMGRELAEEARGGLVKFENLQAIKRGFHHGQLMLTIARPFDARPQLGDIESRCG